MNVNTVVDQGRVHIAVNDRYLGSVNIYESTTSQRITKVFHKSKTVTIGDNLFTVNSNSYKQHLQKFHLTDTTTTSYENVLDQILTITEKLWPHLGVQTQHRILNRYVMAVQQGHFSEAINLVHKGAPIRRFYFCRQLNRYPILRIEYLLDVAKRRHYHHFHDLPEKVEYNCETFTPLSLAILCEAVSDQEQQARNELIHLLQNEFEAESIHQTITIFSESFDLDESDSWFTDEENDPDFDDYDINQFSVCYEIVKTSEISVRNRFHQRKTSGDSDSSIQSI